MQKIAQTQDDEVNIVLEDDVVFNDNIADNLYSVLTESRPAFDILFLGLPSAKTEVPIANQNVKDVFKYLPCCDSYMMPKKTAVALQTVFLPLKFPTNIQLSYLFDSKDMTALLAVPNVFIDGSKIGLYFSSIEVNNRLIFNQEYVLLAKAIAENENLSDEQCNAIDALFHDVKLKTNPEFYYLKAIYESKKGNYEFANCIYEYTYNIYKENGTMLNTQSLFLRDYMRNFKHLQHLESLKA